MNGQAQYLIAVAFGPVQDFIAAARKTRDLWFGSWLLSEISKAAALRLRQRDIDAELIFPTPPNDDALRPSPTPRATDFNVVNQLLACVTGEPKDAVEKAKEAAGKRWKEIANAARAAFDTAGRPYGLFVRDALWGQQVEDVVEAYGAWARLGGDYRQALARLNRELAARKATRDFRPAATRADQPNAYGLPKSSLDAARETVLPEGMHFRLQRRFGLDPGEQLDCPGLVKRVQGSSVDFAALTRVALAPWIAGLEAACRSELTDAYRALFESGADDTDRTRTPLNLATRARGYPDDSLPFDGRHLYWSQLEKAIADNERAAISGTVDDPSYRRLAAQALVAFRDAYAGVRSTYELTAPSPYVAVLLGDGDNMGKLIDQLADAERHRSVSAALAGFAGAVPATVQSFGGQCVYSGGDDVLAFVPVACAISCARELADLFQSSLQTFLPQGDGANRSRPSLSIGLGIGHVLEPLGDLRELARRAEKLAKDGPAGTPAAGQRNALGIIASPRSGAEYVWRGRWDQPAAGIPAADHRLLGWIEAFGSERVSSRLPYQLRELRRELGSSNLPRAVLFGEVLRLLGRKFSEGCGDDLKNALRSQLERGGIEALTDELLIARWLAAQIECSRKPCRAPERDDRAAVPDHDKVPLDRGG